MVGLSHLATLQTGASVRQPFGLSRTELVQIMNLAPTSLVEVHLVVDNADERLGEERMAQLLEVVAAHSPAARQKQQVADGGEQ